MDTYKNLFPENIYCLNYESLVKSPTRIIKSLINWLAGNGMIATCLLS